MKMIMNSTLYTLYLLQSKYEEGITFSFSGTDQCSYKHLSAPFPINILMNVGSSII